MKSSQRLLVFQPAEVIFWHVHFCEPKIRSDIEIEMDKKNKKELLCL